MSRFPCSIILRAAVLASVLLTTTSAMAADRGDRLADLLSGEIDQAILSVLWVASPGWAQEDGQGQPEGVVIEVMNRFGDWLEQEHGLNVLLQFEEEADWRYFYARVRDGQDGLFGLGNVTITEERARELAFSPPYIHNVAVLISSSEHAELTHPDALADQLEGLTAMAFADTLHEQRLTALAQSFWPAMPIDRTGSNDRILQAAAEGTHFGYIDGYHYARAAGEGLPIRRHPAFDDPGESFGIIMPLDNDWQGLLEEFFAAEGGLLGSEWYRELLMNYLGPSVLDLLEG